MVSMKLRVPRCVHTFWRQVSDLNIERGALWERNRMPSPSDVAQRQIMYDFD